MAGVEDRLSQFKAKLAKAEEERRGIYDEKIDAAKAEIVRQAEALESKNRERKEVDGAIADCKLGLEKAQHDYKVADAIFIKSKFEEPILDERLKGVLEELIIEKRALFDDIKEAEDQLSLLQGVSDTLINETTGIDSKIEKGRIAVTQLEESRGKK